MGEAEDRCAHLRFRGSPVLYCAMTRSLLRSGWALLFAGVACGTPRAPEPVTIDGFWEGALSAGSSRHPMRVMMRQEPAGLTGAVDLPDQYATGYSLKDVALNDATLTFSFSDALPPALFSGVLRRGRIVGTFASADGPDTVRGTFDLWRKPEESKPFHTEEVRFANGTVPLRGTLFIPNSPGPHPAVVFLHGSGPQTRESYIRCFADQFARQGIAALIYDKRNTGRTDIPLWQQGGGTFDDFAGDAATAVRFLRGRPEVIDSRRIGLWGLSQGAWLVPLTAARVDSLAFLVLLSGGGVTPARQELYDDEVKLKARGFTETQIAQAISLLRLADDYVRSHTDADWEHVQLELARARREPWFRFLDRFPLILPRESPAWTDTDIDYDPRPALQRLRMPVLVILGERDALTPTTETARAIDSALRAAGNTDYMIRVIPRADHGLFVSTGGDSWLDERPADGWMKEMTVWLVNRVKRN
jgi:dienelactone hydrolase